MTSQSTVHFSSGGKRSEKESTNYHTNLLDTAFQLTRSGISVIATNTNKVPVGGKWGPFQKRIATPDELRKMFNHPLATGIATIGGHVSGNLYHTDFEGKDYQGQPMACIYPEWASLAKLALEERGDASLFDLLVIATTPNSGYHLRWRVAWEQKLKTESLARSLVVDPETGEVLTDERGKPIANLLIESKAEGGCCLSPPSPGYELVQGDLFNIPIIPLEIHHLLISIAKSFHAVPNDVESDGFFRRTTAPADHLRPGDDFNERGDHRPLLLDAGWVIDHAQNGTEYWRRPGKDERWSATWGHIPNRLYVFSSNASPFEENRTYDPFSIYTYLKHNGDFEAAARDLASQGFGTQQNGHRRANRSQSHESQREGKATLFEVISRDIERASTVTDRLERNRLVKVIIDRLVDLEPIDQSMFIDQMKDAGLESKGTLEAQLKEAIKAKQNAEAPQGAPTNFIHTDGEIRSAFGVYEGSTYYFKLVFDRNTNAYYPKPISSFILTPTTRVRLDGYDMFRVNCMTANQSIEGEVMHRKDFNDKKRFKDALKSATLQFFGSDNDRPSHFGDCQSV